MFVNFSLTFLLLLHAEGQEVQTLELSTSTVYPIHARLGSTSLVQLPVEPLATNIGDPGMWLVEKTDRLVSIKPVQAGAQDTSLAIVTRQGTLSFSVHLGSEPGPYTQMIRVTRIVDDSKPIVPMTVKSESSLAETMIEEIRIAGNFYALKKIHDPQIQHVEQSTQIHETMASTHRCTLLEVFRFGNSGHILLHFITENLSASPLAFDHRKTVVKAGETLFLPMAVSLGSRHLSPKGRTENFIILDGSTGLSPRQPFEIFLAEFNPRSESNP